MSDHQKISEHDMRSIDIYLENCNDKKILKNTTNRKTSEKSQEFG